MKSKTIEGYVRDDIEIEYILDKRLYEDDDLCEWVIGLESRMIPVFLDKQIAEEYYKKYEKLVRKVRVTIEEI